jgi:hypothetical protein
MSFGATLAGNVNLANAAQAYTSYPQTEERRPDGTHFEVEQVENGYILRFAAIGYRYKTYVCKTPQELSDLILSTMVVNKMEK